MSENARLFVTEPGGRFEIYLPPVEYTVNLLGYGTGPTVWKGIKSGQKNLVLDLPEFQWSAAEVGKAFDALWGSMDNNYSNFFLKKDVDWNLLNEKYRPVAIEAKNAKELASVLQEMLTPLQDMHVWIETPEGGIPTFTSKGKSGLLYERTCGTMGIFL